MNIFSEAPEVETIGNSIRHAHHGHLVDAKIVYCFIADVDEDGEMKPVMSKGKELWGRARRISSLNAHLAGEVTPFFVIEISQFAWERLDDSQKRALVDHELCHCWVDDEKLTIRPHDVEEFGEVVARHGLWYQGIADFVKVGSDQLKLIEMPPAPPVVIAGNELGITSVTITPEGFENIKSLSGHRLKTDEDVVQHFERELHKRGITTDRGRARAACRAQGVRRRKGGG